MPRFALLTLVAVLVTLDLLLKAWSRAHLAGEFDPLVPGLVSLTLTYNTGAAWSMFSNAALPLAVFRTLVGLGLLAYLWRRRPSGLLSFALGLVAAGALANGVDGLLHGQVTDMLASPALSAVTRALGQGEFPIFNLADVWVVGGVLLMLLTSWLDGRTRRGSSSVTP